MREVYGAVKKVSGRNRKYEKTVQDAVEQEIESGKINDEKFRKAMAYGHRKPYAVTMHDASVGAREDEESNKSDD